jgi:hypothetical protein
MVKRSSYMRTLAWALTFVAGSAATATTPADKTEKPRASGQGELLLLGSGEKVLAAICSITCADGTHPPDVIVYGQTDDDLGHSCACAASFNCGGGPAIELTTRQTCE